MKEITLLEDYHTNFQSRTDYSFLNFASIGSLLTGEYNEERFHYMADGWSSAFLFSVITGRQIHRCSFDFSSLASIVFAAASEQALPVYFLGAAEHEIHRFIEKISLAYPNLNVVGYSNGYIVEDDWGGLISSIMEMKPAIVIVGLGAGKQEKFTLRLRDSGFTGVSFTCGGFISQTSSSNGVDYYPWLIDKLNLRFIYRMIKEPHTIRRYTFDYPKNLYFFIKYYFKGNIVIKVGS